MPFPHHLLRLAACVVAGVWGTAVSAAGDATPPHKASAPVYGPTITAGSLPAVHVMLSRPVYYIHADPRTGAPHMPADVVVTADVQNWPADAPRPTAFTWQVYLDWDFAPYPTHHQICHKTFSQASPLKVDLSGQIRGGQLTVVAKALLNGKEVCGQAHASVLGENPPRMAVLSAFPHNRFGLIASKIGMAESGLRQFTSASGFDPGGLPVVSRTNDLGMMQLNAPSGTIASADEVWDWRANVRRGLLILASKRSTTELASRHAVNLRRVPDDTGYQLACLNFTRSLLGLPCVGTPVITPLSSERGTGMQPGEPDPDKLGLSQVERESIRRYNGGSEYAFQITPDPNTLAIRAAGWQIDPTRGGIRAGAGDPNYVLHVLRARSGLALEEPKPAHSRRRRGHRRHHPHRG